MTPHELIKQKEQALNTAKAEYDAVTRDYYKLSGSLVAKTGDIYRELDRFGLASGDAQQELRPRGDVDESYVLVVKNKLVSNESFDRSTLEELNGELKALLEESNVAAWVFDKGDYFQLVINCYTGRFTHLYFLEGAYTFYSTSVHASDEQVQVLIARKLREQYQYRNTKETLWAEYKQGVISGRFVYNPETDKLETV